MTEGRGHPLFAGADEKIGAAPSHTLSGEAPLCLLCGNGRSLLISDERPVIMGVLNLTPDSFSDGGLHLRPQDALRRAEKMVQQGAEILDLGAESTRPGASAVPWDEQWRRLGEVLPALGRAGLPAVLSIDTRSPEVAERAFDVGATLLNLTFPLEFAALGTKVAARYPAVVLMHSRGTPQTMKDRCVYGDLVADIHQELLGAAEALLVPPEKRIYDPGLGFAKTAEQSLALLCPSVLMRLRALLGRPVLIGASRKSLLGVASGLPVSERLAPSLAAAVLAAQAGAAIVRVHDVAPTRAALSVASAAKAAGGRHAS